MREKEKIQILLNLLEKITQSYDEILKENQRLLKALEKEAITDHLTGLLNRRAVLDTLNKEIERIKRGNKDTLCLCFVDMDNFKSVNDRYGHNEGDKVLKEFARILKRSVRLYDIVGRWGGDEFILGIVNCEHFNNIEKCKKCPIYERISSSIKEVGKKYNIPLNVSCGVAKIPTEVIDLEEAIKLADKRVYKAKELGKGKIIVE
jgi:diguanylate cyclase (GGDEF)-like protein